MFIFLESALSCKQPPFELEIKVAYFSFANIYIYISSITLVLYGHIFH